jgi:glutamine amidotransferase
MSSNTIAVIEGCGNNIASILNALTRLGCNFRLTKNHNEIKRAKKVILPGVGAAKNAMLQLQKAELTEFISELQQPVLGICLGMQLLFEKSQEQDTDCLGIIPGFVKKFTESVDLPVPHMGWNQLKIVQQNALTLGIEEAYCYFVHTYYLPASNYTIATTNYGVSVSAIVQHRNFYGTQFHPEKSGKIGLSILDNFLRFT